MTELLSKKELKKEVLQQEIRDYIWFQFYYFFDRICEMKEFDVDIIETFKDEFVVSLDDLFRQIKT